MKRITLLSLSLLFTTAIIAQENYNRWSVEAGANMTRAFKGYSNSSYNNAMAESIGGEFTARYMINNKFGFQVGGFFGELNTTSRSLPFKTEYYGGQIEAVANLGNLLGFREWTQRLNVLAHAGGGISILNPVSDPNEMPMPFYGNGSADHTPTLVAGLTPQLRLSDRVSLFGDVSFHANWKQDYAWDTNSKIGGRFIESGLATVSAGIQVYLGKNKKHADWVDTNVYQEDLVALDSRIMVVESQIKDLQDELIETQTTIAESQTTNFVDKNNNGIDDAIENYVDTRMADNATAAATAKSLLNNGYVNVYFKFNSAEPETYSLESINYLVKYMQNNPSSTAELIGYSDEIGNAAYNKALSEKRAKKVYDVIVATGISADRLSYEGGGVDDSVDKASPNARQLVRRVTFKLK
ncbi:OmpA family protein [Bizionia myxarmorum]|uniref:OmpA family protein n=1 Tax=Bizionia myxarmorum TaxID=291186 RepID=A0A5D0RDM2_9FLAO|nr:OmpA family protein [Bizionia myxarmorum]TYB79056.1 OmpA family protein [Bizionia myxarmorum]